MAWLAAFGGLGGVSLRILGALAFPRADPGARRRAGIDPYDLGPVEVLPGAGAPPMLVPRGRFWWVVGDEGAWAFSAACTHHGCRFSWKPREDSQPAAVIDRFICPCCGSRFKREGELLAGPAQRKLDQFRIVALDGRGRELARTPKSGGPLPIPAGSYVVVVPQRCIRGEGVAAPPDPRVTNLGCDTYMWYETLE
jgi:nitrite reductase/ring-hydroxylating ferredoxin subunit